MSFAQSAEWRVWHHRPMSKAPSRIHAKWRRLRPQSGATPTHDQGRGAPSATTFSRQRISPVAHPTSSPEILDVHRVSQQDTSPRGSTVYRVIRALRRHPALLPLLAVLFASGCLGGAAAAPGTITGLVAIEGGKVAGPQPQPFAWVDVKGRTTRHITVGSDGRFRLVLPPGTYTVIALLFDGRTRGPQRQVTIASGQTVRIRLLGYIV